ncbi:hypothetical protein Tco_0568371 [Tanacetum coccineum]
MAEHVIAAGADIRHHMLDKSQYNSLQSSMLLYIQGKDHGKQVYDSVINGPFHYGTVEVPATPTSLQSTRDRTYEDLTKVEKIREACDIRATNIVLQGLPPDVYSLMINDMNTIRMSMKPLQVNTKFVNHLQPERSRFVTNVKLAKDMHTTNFDQLYAYLRQHEAHANEVCLVRQNFPDHLALVANTYNSPSCNNNQSQYHQHLSPIAQQFYSPPLQQQSYEARIVHQHSYHPSVVHQPTYQAQVIPLLSPAIIMANLPPNHNEFAPAAEAAPDNMNGWVEEEDPEMEEEEEDPEEDPEMEEEEEEMEMNADEEWDGPEWILPYQGADPLYPPPPASDSESEIEFEEAEAEAEAEAEVAPIPPPVPANPEPKAVTIGIRRLTPLKRLFTDIQVWTGSSSSSAAVGHNPEDLTPSHIRSDLNALHRRNCTRAAWRELDRATWHYHHVRHWSIAVENLLPPHLQYQEPPYALPKALLTPVIHDDPRDPYVAACDAATAPATDNDDSPTQKEASPSELQGSLPRDS